MNANRGAKIVLHWLEKSRAQRIMWLMEELNLSYNIRTYKRGPNGIAPPELKHIHPLGKSPIVSVEPADASPMVLVESAAIIEYFLDHFSGPNTHLVPQRYRPGREGQVGGETEAWMRYRYFMHYAEGSLMSPIQVQLIMNALKNAPVPFFIKPITGFITGKVSAEFLDQELRTHFRFLEDQLASAPEEGPFLCGSRLTAADIQMSIPVIAALNLSIIPRKEYPRLDVYAGVIQNEQGYRRAVEKVERIEGRPFVPI
ncbi:glutathione S-transferase [Aspergillus novofumigatus IBT 16806]|uniref:Glutathione S-transferase n=1 Tax=Aspergillus novofumigatus (strain IBT 16806) TaxID=1392255 RepID=A0A2I1CPR3_ASPN1|nr:glutathione S-transferase [Aspergillus novofumigatus IBT 16806]PKX99622.1 glutathione S-transferase [Aspergillus novofumigatus IBT 16806]